MLAKHQRQRQKPVLMKMLVEKTRKDLIKVGERRKSAAILEAQKRFSMFVVVKLLVFLSF